MQSKIVICCFAFCAALFAAAYPALAGSDDTQHKGSAGIEPLLHQGSYGLDMLLDQLLYLLPDEGDGNGASIFTRAGTSPSDHILIGK